MRLVSQLVLVFLLLLVLLRLLGLDAGLCRGLERLCGLQEELLGLRVGTRLEELAHGQRMLWQELGVGAKCRRGEVLGREGCLKRRRGRRRRCLKARLWQQLRGVLPHRKMLVTSE